VLQDYKQQIKKRRNKMKWFKDMKVGVKLTIGFGFAALISVVIGLISYNSLTTMTNGNKAIYNENLIPIKILGEINAAMYKTKGDARAMQSALNDTEKDKNMDLCRESGKLIDSQTEQYALFTKNTEGIVTAKKARDIWKECVSYIEKAYLLIKKGEIEQATVVFNGECGPRLKQSITMLSTLIQNDEKQAESVSAGLEKTASNAEILMILIVVIAFVITILIGLYITKLITAPVHEVLEVIDALSIGSLAKRMSWDSEDEYGQMSKRMNSFVEFLAGYIRTIYLIAEGDFSYRRKINDPRNEMAPALETIVATLKDLTHETDLMIEHYSVGDTDFKGNAEKFKGGYKTLVDGFNHCYEITIGVVRDGMQAMGIIADGDLTHRMEGDLQNRYKIYKDVINTLGESLEQVVS
jgi:methyl-accepting chemotaxis protein